MRLSFSETLTIDISYRDPKRQVDVLSGYRLADTFRRCIIVADILTPGNNGHIKVHDGLFFRGIVYNINAIVCILLPPMVKELRGQTI